MRVKVANRLLEAYPSDVKELANEFCYVLGEYFIDSDNGGLLESL